MDVTSPQILVGSAAAFGAVSVGVWVAHGYLDERRRIRRSLKAIGEYQVSRTDLRAQELATPFVDRILSPGLMRVGGFMRRFTPRGVIDRLATELRYAGSPQAWDAERLLATKLAAAVVIGGCFGLLFPMIGVPTVRAIVLAGILAAAGYYVPEWILRSRATERQAAIQRALPDALDLLSITVEAGLGFDDAVARVALEARGPLGEELHRVVKEMQLGQSRVESLRGLADRSSAPELKAFVLAMIQADVFGIPIGRVLQIQAEEMRMKRRQRAEEQAQKLPVKLVFPLIFCIFPSLFVILLGPAAIRIYENILSR